MREPPKVFAELSMWLAIIIIIVIIVEFAWLARWVHHLFITSEANSVACQVKYEYEIFAPCPLSQL